MPKPFCLLLLIALTQTGCFRNAYFVSPYNGNHSVYHPIRMQSDSLSSAWHAHAAVYFGQANDGGADDVFALHTGLSGSHNFGAFQGFYSFNVSAGNYRADAWNSGQEAKNYSFGGAGFEGGMNVVASFEKMEWRVLGVETAWQHEWGQYLQFRKNLSYNDVDYLVKSRDYKTLGGYTELVARTGKSTVGFRLAYGTALGRWYRQRSFYYDFDYDRLPFRYGHFTTHLSRGKYTGYIRIQSATRAGGVLFGFNYRLGK